MSPRNTGRLIALPIVLIALGILEFTTKHNGRTTFTPANVSIAPGKGWKVMEISADPPACTPQLAGDSGLIQAMIFDADITDLQSAADKLQSSFASNEKAIPDSFKQEPFTTETGLTGIHLSYSGRASKDAPPSMRSHTFITHNMYKRFVSVSYLTTTD